MKLYEGAVFLIIAGAVIGPIRSAQTGWEESEPFGRVYETIAETCDRALQEVGAAKMRQWYLHRDGLWLHVVCVPAPSGLRQ